MTDDNRLDALCHERKRPVRPRVVDVPIDRHDRFNKAPFSFVRPFATLPEIDLVVRDMREPSAGRSMVTVRHRIEMVKDRRRSIQDVLGRIEADQESRMPHRVVRPHEEAVAVLGQRENNDVLHLVIKVVPHFHRVIEFCDVRIQIERVVEGPRSSEED